jgi:LPS export ABC transporter permease LptF
MQPVKILDRYLAREMLVPLLVGLTGFCLLMLGNVLYLHWQLLRQAGASTGLAFRLLCLRAPEVASWGLPFAALLATCWALNRLGRESELIAMRMAGVPVRRLALAPLLVGAAVSAAAFLNGEHLVPVANHRAEQIVRLYLLRSPMPLFRERTFVHVPPNLYLYVERLQPGTGHFWRIMVYEVPPAGYPVIHTAKSGYFTKGTLVLFDGVRHQFGPEGRWLFEARFRRAQVRVGQQFAAALAEQKTPREMTSKELSRYIALFARSGADVSSLRLEYQWKFALPLAPLVAVLLAAPLSVRFSRTGSLLGLLIAFLLAFAYQVLMAWSRLLGDSGALPGAVAAWSPNLVFAALGLALLFKQE